MEVYFLKSCDSVSLSSSHMSSSSQRRGHTENEQTEVPRSFQCSPHDFQFWEKRGIIANCRERRLSSVSGRAESNTIRTPLSLICLIYYMKPFHRIILNYFAICSKLIMSPYLNCILFFFFPLPKKGRVKGNVEDFSPFFLLIVCETAKKKKKNYGMLPLISL